MRTRLMIATVVAAAIALSLTFGGVFAGPSEAGSVESPAASGARGSAELLEDLLTGLSSGDTASYAAGLEARLDAAPGDSGLHALLGLAYQQLARETADPSYYSRAQAAYDRAQELDPDDPIAATGQASVATIRHRFADGAKLARRALELSPNNATAYAVLGDALLELGRYDAAFKAIDRAAELSPTVGTYARVANARELTGRPRAALSAVALALELGRGVPEHRAWTLVEGGNIALRAGKEKKARRMYAQALRDVPGYVHAEAALAALAAADGRHADAAARYESVLERLPLPAYYIALAGSLDALGRRAAAETAYDRAAKVIDAQTANGVRTELARAELLLTRGTNPKLALALARRGTAEAPNIEAQATLAWALLENGQCARARVQSKRALELGTTNALAFEHRSRIEACLGNDRAAAAWLARARA